MLRWLVLLLAVVNVVLFVWGRSGAPWTQDDREPQRLQHQVAPDSIQVLPDLPASAAAGAVGASAASAASAPSAAEAASASSPTVHPTAASDTPSKPSAVPARPSASGAASSSLARKTSDLVVDCAESGPLDDGQLTALRRTLAQAGVTPDELSDRRVQAPASWMIYMGRFADPIALQHKADELARMNLKFDRVDNPPALSPGLSLGSFASAADANAGLADLAKRGVHTARVVVAKAPGALHRLQVRAADDGWRRAVAAQRFNACPAPGAESL